MIFAFENNEAYEISHAHTFLLTCLHVLEMFENKNPLHKNIGSFMQKHKHGTKLTSLSELVKIPN
jgi:hypothetical protein